MPGILFGLATIGLIIWRLTQHFNDHTRLERISMGMIGAGIVLLYPSFWQVDNPFGEWASHLATTGTALFLYATLVKRKCEELNTPCD